MWNCFSVKTPSRGSDQCEGNARTLAFVAKLVYAPDLGSGVREDVWVRVPSDALSHFDDLNGRYANGKRSALNPDAGKTVTSSSLVPSAGKGTIGTNSKTVVHLLNNTLSLKGRYSKITG